MIQISAARISFWIGACLVLAQAHNLFAQAANNRARDEAAIRQAGKDYLAALERGDDKALAEFWTADGTFVDETGRTINVRELLAKTADQRGDVGPRAQVPNAKIKFIAADVAIEQGEYDSPAGAGEAPAKGSYTAIWVRDGARWKLENLREARRELTASANPLASLDIFAGEWTGEVNGIKIQISAKWDANRKFLHRKVTMTSGRASLVGTQQVGWDPLARQIRSWMFSDDGSFSEGIWSMEGNLWIVLASRVLSDARVSDSTQIYKFTDKNTLVWKSIRGSIDGQPTDDFEVVLKRSAAR